MQEWGVALITIMFPHLFPHLLAHFLKGTKERVGCVGSFLAALTHVACTSEEEELLCQSIQYTLPWCMAQHFNTRLYAQVSLRKIWHHCEARGIKAVLEKYPAVQQCLQFVVEQGNAARNTLNMLNDFYFKVFHPIQHYTLEVNCLLISIDLFSYSVE
nr:probable methyltransferase TARBP1 [Cherax quadricarinatus]